MPEPLLRVFKKDLALVSINMIDFYPVFENRKIFVE